MNNVVLSLRKNVLKITNIEKDKLTNISAEISTDYVDGNLIKEVGGFSSAVMELLKNNISNFKSSKYILNIVVEPENIEACFLTIPKSSDLSHESVVEEIKSRFSDLNLEEYFFSYEKIAPFVYQFVAVKKEVMEIYLQLSDELNMSLGAVIPWVLALPKYLGNNDPAIFVSSDRDGKLVAVSELGGIFFSVYYDDSKMTESLDKILLDLSHYKRKKPINQIYEIDCEIPPLEGDYLIKELEIGESKEASSGYESNLLVQYIIDVKKDLLDSQINLLNTLPLPVSEKPEVSLAKIAKVGVPVVVSAFLIFGIFMVFSHRNPDSGLSTDGGSKSQEQVLSSHNESETAAESTASAEEQTVENLDKSELTIRVENGSGINGIAAKTKTLLESLSYKVVDIGTADELSAKTVLQFKKEKIKYRDILSDDLKEGYSEIEIKEDLPDDSSYDLLITVGENVSL